MFLIYFFILGYAARHNTTPPFTANKMLQLLTTACENITPDDWKKVINKTKKIIADDWERDLKFDSICDREFIINLQKFSSESDSDDSDLGCIPLRQ